VPDGLTLGEAHARASQLEERIKAGSPEIAEINTHIEPTLLTTSACERPGNADLERMISEATQSMPEVLDCRETQAHWVEGRLFLAVRCILDEGLPIVEAHDIATAIEDRLRRKCPEIAHVSVHVEPGSKYRPSLQD